MTDEHEVITVGTNLLKKEAELLDCIVLASDSGSKSDIVKEAIRFYVANCISPSIMDKAKEIQRIKNMPTTSKEEQI